MSLYIISLLANELTTPDTVSRSVKLVQKQSKMAMPDILLPF